MGNENQEQNEQQEEKPVVQEHINPKFRKRLKKVLEVAVLALVAGVVFGVSARLVFNLTGDGFFSNEDETKQADASEKRTTVNLRTASEATPSVSVSVSAAEKQPVSLAVNENTETKDRPGSVKQPETGIVLNGEKDAEGEKTGDREAAGEKSEAQGKTPAVEATGSPVVLKNENTDPAKAESSPSPSENTDKTEPEGDTVPDTGLQVGDGKTDTDEPGTASEDSNQDGNVSPEDGTEQSEDGAEDTQNAGDKSENTFDTSENKGEELGNPLTYATSLEGFIRVMDELHGITSEAEKCLLTVNGITRIVNWMGEPVETVEESVGVIAADNGVELLVVTYYDRIKSADLLEVRLKSGMVCSCELLSYDESLNMAVVAVPLKKIPEDEYEKLGRVAFGSTDNIYAGMPVIAIGCPNGNMGSVEYGYITGVGQEMYVPDGVCRLFTTDLSQSEGSEGIIINYDGELIGVISRGTAASELTGNSTEITVESLVEVAECLCNGTKRPVFGVLAEDIPADVMKELEIGHGIYVNEVLSASPAEAADMHKGDIILSVDGTDIDSVEQFSRLVLENIIHNPMEVKLYRSSRKGEPELTVQVIPQ